MTNPEVCPWCGAKALKSMSTSKGVITLYECWNIFENGSLHDKRHLTCMNLQIARLQARIAKLERVKDAAEILRLILMDIHQGEQLNMGAKLWRPMQWKSFLNLQQALADVEAQDEK